MNTTIGYAEVDGKTNMNKQKIIIQCVVTLGLIGLLAFVVNWKADQFTQSRAALERMGGSTGPEGSGTNVAITPDMPLGERLAKIKGLKTDFSKTSIDIKKIKNGGPPKDGIPSIDKPKFEALNATQFPDDAEGILVQHDGQQRFYPYNIIVFHELVNDSLGDYHILVSYCPLCGSGIVFNRKIKGKIYDFGVSGYLFESNLLMYDRITESLWSQARTESVVGEMLGIKLKIEPMQLITLGEVKKKYPQAKILSTDTGHRRNYMATAYEGYFTSDGLMFPITNKDERFKNKEMMYITEVGDKSLAIPLKALTKPTQTQEIDGKSVEVKKDGDEIRVTADGKNVPGYFEMWFSWYTHHGAEGLVWKTEAPKTEKGKE